MKKYGAGYLKKRIRVHFLSLTFYYFVRRGKWGGGYRNTTRRQQQTQRIAVQERRQKDTRGVQPPLTACEWLLLFLCAEDDLTPCQSSLSLLRFSYIPNISTQMPQRNLKLEMSHPGTSLVVQWVRLCVPNAGGPGSIPGQGTRSRMHAETKKSACCN